MPSAWTRSSTLRVETPSSVRLRHHRRERLLGPAPGLEQPAGEVRPVPELRDLQVDGADPRVPGPPAVPVPGVLPLLVPLPVAGPAGRVDLCAHQRTDHRRQHGLQRVRRRLLDLLAKPLDRIDAGRGGHRSLLGGNHLAGCFLKDDAVAALLNFGASSVHHSTGRYWTFRDSPRSKKPTSIASLRSQRSVATFSATQIRPCPLTLSPCVSGWSRRAFLGSRA